MKKKPRFSVCMVLEIERKMKMRRVKAQNSAKNTKRPRTKSDISLCTSVVETIYVHSETSMPYSGSALFRYPYPLVLSLWRPFYA